MDDLFEWLATQFWGMIEWLANTISSFFSVLVGTLQSLIRNAWNWLGAQFDAFLSLLAEILPLADPNIENLATTAINGWEKFEGYVQLMGYFVHFPTLYFVVSFILLVEGILLVIQIYLFIKRLVPMA